MESEELWIEIEDRYPRRRGETAGSWQEAGPKNRD